jgi:hypothetical protein
MDDMLYDYKWMEQFLLNYMSKWFAVNGLSLSTEKTNTLHFKTNHLQNDSFQIFYQGTEIKEETNIKFIGQGLDKHDSYRDHNNNLKKRAVSALHSDLILL